jgi:hypothetical protein
MYVNVPVRRSQASPYEILTGEPRATPQKLSLKVSMGTGYNGQRCKSC